MANIAIFGTLQNVTNGVLAEGTQIVGGRMSVATIAERDAIPAGVLKDGTEVYVTETKLTYRWNAEKSEFVEFTSGTRWWTTILSLNTSTGGYKAVASLGEEWAVGDYVLSKSSDSDGYYGVVTGTVVGIEDSYNVRTIGRLSGANGEEGLGMFTTTYYINASSTSIQLSQINIPTGRSIKVGDLIMNEEWGYTFKVTAVNSTTATISYITTLRGPAGAKGETGKAGLSIFTSSQTGTTSSTITLISDQIKPLTAFGRSIAANDLVLTADSNLFRILQFGETTTQVEFVQSLAGENGTKWWNTNKALNTTIGEPSIVLTMDKWSLGDFVMSTNGYYGIVTGQGLEGTYTVTTQGDLNGPGGSSATLVMMSVADSAWSALVGDYAPYTYYATVTIEALSDATEYTIVELINSDAVLFAQHGFAIGSISGTSCTLYSIGKPTKSMPATFRIGG